MTQAELSFENTSFRGEHGSQSYIKSPTRLASKNRGNPFGTGDERLSCPLLLEHAGGHELPLKLRHDARFKDVLDAFFDRVLEL